MMQAEPFESEVDKLNKREPKPVESEVVEEKKEPVFINEEQRKEMRATQLKYEIKDEVIKSMLEDLGFKNSKEIPLAKFSMVINTIIGFGKKETKKEEQNLTVEDIPWE